jgi:hypothetical protein
MPRGKRRTDEVVRGIDWLWSAAIVASALGVGAVTFGGVSSPARPFVALWFLFVCPGMAFVRLLRLGDLLTELIFALALSLALDAIVAAGMIYARAWSPDLGLALLIGISIAGVLLQHAILPRTAPAAR